MHSRSPTVVSVDRVYMTNRLFLNVREFVDNLVTTKINRPLQKIGLNVEKFCTEKI